MLEHSVVIEDGESKLDAYRRGLKELDQIAAELRKEAGTKTILTGEVPEIMTDRNENNTVAALIADIYSCTEIKVLESYKLMVKADPQLQAAYSQHMTSLIDKLRLI